MRKTHLAMMAICTSLLWSATALAGNPKLTTCTNSLSTCQSSLSSCDASLTAAQACGNGVIDSGEQCDQDNLNSQTCLSQGFFGGTLKCGANCSFDTSGCVSQRFTDNGDGTLTDNQTGLMWEKKTGTPGTPPATPSVNDVNNTYTWSTGFPWLPDGTVFTTFLGTLNNGSSDGSSSAPTGCFANHCDWRLPTIAELLGIFNQPQGACTPGGGGSGPCIDPAFGPTTSGDYWSGTTDSFSSLNAWCKFAVGGGVGACTKDFTGANVRAVRGGS